MSGASRILAVFLLVAPPAAADEPIPRAVFRLEPERATVGDRLEGTLEVVVAEGTRVERPGIESELGDFAVEEVAWTGPEPVDGGQRHVWKGSLAAYRTGEIRVPPVTVRISGADGERELRSEPITVTIESVLEGEGDPDLADLKGPASLPADYGPLWLAGIIVAALATVAAVAWWLHRRYAQRLAAAPAPDPFERMAPHEWVYRELQRMLDRRLLEQGKTDLFLAELSRVLKRYLAGRYRVDLVERTTAEVAPTLEQAGAPVASVRSTTRLLGECDAVKFARVVPDAGTCRAAVEEVYRIVDATRPVGDGVKTERGAA